MEQLLEDHNTSTPSSSRIHIRVISCPALEVSDMRKKPLVREKMTEGQQECVNVLEDKGLLGKPYAVERCMGQSVAPQKDRIDRMRTEALWWLYQ